jgi:hypothetical protein
MPVAVGLEGEGMAEGAFIVLAAGCLAVLAVLLLDMAGIRRMPGAGRRWQGAGILLSTSGVMISSLAALRGWPPVTVHRIHLVMLVFVVAGTAILIVGLGIRGRSGQGSSRS